MAIILNCSDLIPLSSGLLRWRKLQWKGNSKRVFLTKEENFDMLFWVRGLPLITRVFLTLKQQGYETLPSVLSPEEAIRSLDLLTGGAK